MKRLLVVLALALPPTAVAQPIIIDEFTTEQLVEGEINAPEAIGGVRFLLSDVSTGTATISAGLLTAVETAVGGSGDSAVYDGLVDGTVISNNLGGLAFNANGNDRIEFDVTAITGTATVFVALDNCFVSTTVGTPGTFQMPFDQSGSGGNDCSVQASSVNTVRLAFLFGADGDAITLDSIRVVGPPQSVLEVPTLSAWSAILLFLVIAATAVRALAR